MKNCVNFVEAFRFNRLSFNISTVGPLCFGIHKIWQWFAFFVLIETKAPIKIIFIHKFTSIHKIPHQTIETMIYQSLRSLYQLEIPCERSEINANNSN